MTAFGGKADIDEQKKASAMLTHELLNQAQDRADLYGPNDWSSVLYWCLASTPVFTSGGFGILDDFNEFREATDRDPRLFW